MNPITVRRATEHDADAVVPIWREMMELHQEIEPMVWTMVSNAEDLFRSYFLECLGDPDHMIAVAAGGDEILGFIHAGKGRRPPVMATPVEGAIHGCCVTRRARREGIGKMLVAEAMDWFRGQGLTAAKVAWAIGNSLSGPFWNAEGFRPYMVTGIRPTGLQKTAESARFDDAEPYFAVVAKTYDRLRPIIAGPNENADLAAMVDLVPRDGRDAFTFLDLGCGTGTVARSMLDRFPASAGTAIDGEPAMLDVARRKLAPYSERVELRQGDLLTCELATCDVILSSYVFHHISPEVMTGLLVRIAQALRPGGCFILLDQMTAGPRWGERVGAVHRRLQERHVAAAIAAGRTTREELDARWAFKRRMKEEGKDIEYRHSAEQIAAAMKEAGFSEIGLVWRMFAATILIAFAAGGGA